MICSVWDIAVAGAGPAGSFLAGLLARENFSVLLLEKETFPRNKSCGGGLPPHATKLLDSYNLPWRSTVVNSVEQAHLFFDFNSPIEINLSDHPLQLVTRRQFDTGLASWAVDQGAELRTGSPLQSYKINDKEIQLNISGTTSEKSRYLIGAGGAAGPVTRRLNPEIPPHAGMTAYLKVPDEIFADYADRVIFDVQPDYQGYAWIFPKQDHLNVGLGGYETEGLKPGLYQYLEATFENIDYRLQDSVGHPLPFYSPGRQIVDSPVALVGDAAGLVDGLIGEGIFYALKSAELCAKSFAAGSSPLIQYKKELKTRLLPELNWSRRIGRFAYQHPRLAYEFGFENAAVREYLKDIVSGKCSYRNLVKQFSPRLPVSLSFPRRED